MTWNWTCTDRCTDTHPPSWHFPPHYFTDELKVFSFFFSWFYLLCTALSRIFLILFMHTLASTLCYLCILRCCSRFEKTLQETRLQEDSKGGIKRLTVPDGRRFTNPQWVVEVMKSLISDSLEAPPDQLNSFKMTDLGVCVRVCLWVQTHTTCLLPVRGGLKSLTYDP